MDTLLNEDCWFTILQYLQLEDQLTLGEVSHHLQRCVTRHWKCLTNAKINGQVLKKFILNSFLMFEFASTACGTLQKLTIDGDIIDLLNSWRIFNFPKLHTLDCNWEPERLNVLHTITENALMDQWLLSIRWQQADEISMLLTELFPHLRKLTLHANVRGCHLWRLSQLEELHICKSPTSEIHKFIARILIIPKLHKLHLHESQSLIEFINQNPLKVKSIRFIHNRPLLRLAGMENLQVLAIHGCKLDNGLWREFVSEIPSLEQLHLTEMDESLYESHDAEKIWYFVAQFGNLKVVNLSGSCINPHEFVLSGAKWLSVALKDREVPLMLHIDPKITSPKSLTAFKQILTTLRHPKLVIKFEPIAWERTKIFCTKYMEVEFMCN
ncbi:uncharacterized protein LOC124460309 [Drosophila willistoni]|uniref:uncharacterized protein LOC124460309 n=1 Tax=Drosophila willistoni TaxID=7260 RepID=UPI001F076DFD|nr:uncharacterized protein LOC124460309 [Drosophila willistoni]